MTVRAPVTVRPLVTVLLLLPLRPLAIVLFLLAFVGPGWLQAHEMGAMKVMVTFRADGAYIIEVVIDGDHLPPGLSPFPGLVESRAGTSDPSREEMARRLADFRRQFLDDVQVAFDGTPAEVVEQPEAASEEQPEAVPGEESEVASEEQPEAASEEPRNALTTPTTSTSGDAATGGAPPSGVLQEGAVRGRDPGDAAPGGTGSLAQESIQGRALSGASPQDDASRKIVFHLRGVVPPGARTFSWSHGMWLGTYLLGIQNEGDPRPSYQWLPGGRASQPYPLLHVAAPPSRVDIIKLYLALGYTHIVPKGLDHILFVLGIYFLSLTRRTILLQVTAFTVAHSITLGLTIYGIVSLSPRIVEPLIALSIVYVAVENLLVSEFKPWRLGVVFGFGLLHGMGFAGVLRELGLPRSEFLPALVSFNVGVELGQLTVIAAAFLLCGLWFGNRPWYRARITQPASAAIACVGVFWTIQRVLM